MGFFHGWKGLNVGSEYAIEDFKTSDALAEGGGGEGRWGPWAYWFPGGKRRKKFRRVGGRDCARLISSFSDLSFIVSEGVELEGIYRES